MICFVDYHNLVWNTLSSPKSFFCSWFIILNRLPTKDRLGKCGLLDISDCNNFFCVVENRNHLFWDCPAVQAVYARILPTIGLSAASIL